MPDVGGRSPVLRGAASVRVPLKRFYMARHGETVANAQGCVAGSFDVPLTDKGRQQAQSLRLLVEAALPRPGVIVCSNLVRARETALILNSGLNSKMVEKTELAERCFGAWRGKPWHFVRHKIQQGEDPPHGEGAASFVGRVVRGLAEVLESYDDVLIVTHGGVFDAMLQECGFSSEGVKNCQLYEFEPQGRPHPFSWGVWHHFMNESGRPERLLLDIPCGGASSGTPA